MEKEKIKVDLHSLHESNIISKSWYLIIVIASKAIFGTTGVFITYILYSKCLFCNNCNNLVIIHLSAISLCCLGQIGIQPEKFIKINVGSKVKRTNKKRKAK